MRPSADGVMDALSIFPAREHTIAKRYQGVTLRTAMVLWHLRHFRVIDNTFDVLVLLSRT